MKVIDLNNVAPPLYSAVKILFWTGMMQSNTIKQEVYRLLDILPDTATRDDLMYRIYVHQAVEADIKDSEDGRTLD